MTFFRAKYPILSLACLFATASAALADEPASIEFPVQRKVGTLDQATILLRAKGDLLVKSTSGSETPERQSVSLTCRREFVEKTLCMPTEKDNALRTVRYYHEAEAELQKGDAKPLKPELRPESRLVGVEVAGAKLRPFSLRGPLNVDELELLTAVGDTLSLDHMLCDTSVKVNDSWPVANSTLALLLGLDEVTANNVKTTLTEITGQFVRMEIEGHVEGKLYGAANQIELKAKCRFNRLHGRIDWFALRIEQKRDPSVVESGLDWTVLVQTRVTPVDKCDELSDKVLADLPTKPTDDLLLVQYRFNDDRCQLTHDRSWFLTGHYRDEEEFHRLKGGQDIGMCKISPQPQLSVAKLPTLDQFGKVVRDALGGNYGSIDEIGEAQNAGPFHVLRVRVKGSDNGTPVRWFCYHVSDPEGRQVAFTFRVEEKNLDAFGRADEALVQSLRFIEKK